MIVIYTSELCPNCKVVKNFMENKKISYTERKIEKEQNYGLYNADKLIKCKTRREKNNRELPLLVIDNTAYTTDFMFRNECLCIRELEKVLIE